MRLSYALGVLRQEGFLPAHRECTIRQEELDKNEKKIEACEAIVRPRWKAAQIEQSLRALDASAMDAVGSGTSEDRPLTRSNAKISLDGLKIVVERERDILQQMREAQRMRDELRREIELLREELGKVDDRVRLLQINEDAVAESIRIAARGERPVAPTKDRRLKLAAVGIIGGFGLSFGFFFLLGTVDRRAYRAAQLRGVRVPRCLGVLPDLGRGQPNPEKSAMAAHCVHQIRNHIEVLRKDTTGFVLAVSSPYQGDGKTNIVMALGWSYATAGNRTLLVDCDFTGTSLTRQMGMSGRPGLKEALREGHVNGQVMTHRIPGLSILPAGHDPDVGPETLRRTDLKKLFSELRRQFDIVIVDTGPTLASLEGIPVASAADNTILSIRRGRRRPLLEECIERLNAVGASCLGVVLNYADQADCDRYVSKASLSVPRGEPDKKTGALEADSPDEHPLENAKHSALIRAMSDASTQTRTRRVPPQ
jgi:Mrp family chromosome partitioning ATPase